MATSAFARLTFFLSCLCVGACRHPSPHTFMFVGPSSLASDARISKMAAVMQRDAAEAPAASNIRVSANEKARTITHVCNSGTLSTISSQEDSKGLPFGSYVDYILDDKGWPVLLLSDQAVHTQNIIANSRVSLFCQLPKSQTLQQQASLSRVTIMGQVVPVPPEEMLPLKMAYCLIHSYAEQIVDSDRFKLLKIQPEKVYFSGGFGVQSRWVDVPEYEKAKPDVLAQEIPTILSRLNVDRQADLHLLAKHFLKREAADEVRIQAVDRLGIDLRVKFGERTEEYRVAFRHAVMNSEDAKSELTKLFQEAWERDNGFFFEDEIPLVSKYAEDILRQKGTTEGFPYTESKGKDAE